MPACPLSCVQSHGSEGMLALALAEQYMYCCKHTGTCVGQFVKCYISVCNEFYSFTSGNIRLNWIDWTPLVEFFFDYKVTYSINIETSLEDSILSSLLKTKLKIHYFFPHILLHYSEHNNMDMHTYMHTVLLWGNFIYLLTFWLEGYI